MTRVIVHAGYHKTGTTSLQDFLYENRSLLKPYLHYYGKNAFAGAGGLARIYAQRPFPWRLYQFRRAFRSFLASIPEAGTIVLSRETFSGGMPGHRRIGGAMMTLYHGPAVRLARVIITELRRRFGDEVKISFFYTTREREAWIESVHGHLLRSIRLTDDFERFRARFPALASPAEEARRMAGALAPVPVVTAALEECGGSRYGPASALLDMVGVPAETRARMVSATCKNKGQNSDLRASFLQINRQKISKSEIKSAKQALIGKTEPVQGGRRE